MIDITRILKVQDFKGDVTLFNVHVNLITDPHYVLFEISDEIDKKSIKCILRAEQARALAEALRDAALEADAE